MKKLVATIATTSVVFTGVAAMEVSAAEYEVQEQDTLWGIAQQHDTSVQALYDLNGLDSSLIHPGQTITTNEEEQTETENTESYTVVEGDTLSGIGSEFNVTVDKLMEQNDLSSTLIVVGQELKVNQTNAAPEENMTEVEEPEASSDDASSNEQAEEPEQEQSSDETTQSEEPVAEEVTNEEQPVEESSNTEGETMTVTATAYTADCDGCTGVTSTGIDLNANPNKKVIAVDPNVIPLGSEVYVEGYGNAIAGDVGGAIKGDKIDLHVPSKEEAYNWGVQTVEIIVLD